VIDYTFDEYQVKVRELAISMNKFKERYPNIDNDLLTLVWLTYDGLGLGEAGEVQGKIKKIIRDNGGKLTPEARDGIKDELGDTLWYIASMCQTLGITLSDVAESNIKKLHDRRARGVLEGSGDNR